MTKCYVYSLWPAGSRTRLGRLTPDVNQPNPPLNTITELETYTFEDAGSVPNHTDEPSSPSEDG